MSLLLNYTFPKELKIRKTSQYEEIFGKSKRLRSKYFDILYVQNSLGYSRAGLVVSKKNVRSAVKRNRIKRLVREVFRNNKSLFDSLDVVFLAKKGSDTLNYSNVKREIEETIRLSLS
ncbi:MAG: ribonuclease P protein component [Candidatus Dadabacteria bacterium]|jgi:ribonuclease P protein component|nr:ribonuclease P protein component [Candidatus Dadabacteria bacterium]MCZ6554660.1 ribonuclease P protein component [Candidatus Dadabacteria bacterium]MCZ6685835.1 ribonuclease P protein component [Candidatus Dadabacteria bacterium]MCZ6790414.1 ribonuclease P protein component [Candidatus Dadabacteria bacterium]MCZ6863989.1 ribonuclease P protein component [Candidatus Dadabacteria bacterium]